MRVATILTALAPLAAAQFDLSGLLAGLPSDIQSYIISLETQPAVLAAVAQAIAIPAVQTLLADLETNPLAAESLVPVVESQLPSSIRPLFSSVVGVIEADASTDGLLSSATAIASQHASVSSEVGSIVSNFNSQVSSFESQIGSAYSSVVSNISTAMAGMMTTASAGASSASVMSTSPSGGAAAQPTVMAMGAVAAGLLGLAAAL